MTMDDRRNRWRIGRGKEEVPQPPEISITKEAFVTVPQLLVPPIDWQSLIATFSERKGLMTLNGSSIFTQVTLSLQAFLRGANLPLETTGAQFLTGRVTNIKVLQHADILSEHLATYGDAQTTWGKMRSEVVEERKAAYEALREALGVLQESLKPDQIDMLERFSKFVWEHKNKSLHGGVTYSLGKQYHVAGKEEFEQMLARYTFQPREGKGGKVSPYNL